jgi:hypothetical protein
MPLFDLFKKSPGKEPAKDDPTGSPELQKRRYEAATEFVAALKEKTPLVGGVPHAGTVLAVPARLAGSSLYRSLHYKDDITPGVVVLSEQVNEAYPQLLNQFAYYCKQHGFDVMSKPLVTHFPGQSRPLLSLEQILAEYQDQYHEIMEKHGLDYLEGARAGMIICSIFFEYFCRQAKTIDPFVATGIVAMGVVEGAKTAPPPLGSRASKSASSALNTPGNSQMSDLIVSIARNSTSGAGDRLVLGEGMTPMQEALSHGGKYILVHPGVLSKLKDGNIDAFLIYAAALQAETAARISRIDFVGGDVDELFRAWSGRSAAETPLHVRQLQWLRGNASALGYEQNGNSWILTR